MLLSEERARQVRDRNEEVSQSGPTKPLTAATAASSMRARPSESWPFSTSAMLIHETERFDVPIAESLAQRDRLLGQLDGLVEIARAQRERRSARVQVRVLRPFGLCFQQPGRTLGPARATVCASVPAYSRARESAT
ncbi:MAG: hypothetical protein AUI83_05710 [Armatimonadetes bacterium 13_1_40CM_3_65_7]|nr:MAG: hypothetical protein AUI83_05710 [Armatimonadetes bacterium 13_1_40CM_3_65_7]